MKDEIVLYQPDSTIQLEVRLQDETVWLNRNQMAELFDRDVKTIGKHINNALHEELAPTIQEYAVFQNGGNATVAKFAIVQQEGGRKVLRQIEFATFEMLDVRAKGYGKETVSHVALRHPCRRCTEASQITSFSFFVA